MALLLYLQNREHLKQTIEETQNTLQLMVIDIELNDSILSTKRNYLRFLYDKMRNLNIEFNKKMMMAWSKYNEEHTTYCSLDKFGEYVIRTLEDTNVIGNDEHGNIYQLIRMHE